MVSSETIFRYTVVPIRLKTLFEGGSIHLNFFSSFNAVENSYDQKLVIKYRKRILRSPADPFHINGLNQNCLFSDIKYRQNIAKKNSRKPLKAERCFACI